VTSCISANININMNTFEEMKLANCLSGPMFFLNKLKNAPKNVALKFRCKKRIKLLDALVLSTKESIITPLKTAEVSLIVSFTTYSKRIHDAHLVVESIAQQTLKPHRIILWLDENEFTLETITEALKMQVKRGLEVRFCPNFRSYKKLIPTLQHFPDANVITIDDDILYPPDMIEILLKEHQMFPEYVLGNRVHRIRLNGHGEVLPYINWEWEIKRGGADDLVFITSGGGTLFPSKCFSREVMNSDVFLEICPNADDVWFKAMSLLNGVKSKKVNDDRAFSERFLPIPGSQDIALFKYNVDECGNDKQLKAVFEKYDLFKYLKYEAV